MEWFNGLFFEHSAMQAVIVMAVIIALGLGLGKLRVCGISLGMTCVFFSGILIGHLGFSIDPDMLKYAESFGLVLFVYELGLQVGPGFFSSFRQGGILLNMLAFGVVAIGTLMAVLISEVGHVPMGDMIGILCGATTNTPALGAAQQALEQLGESADRAALSCAITYPLGVVGVILAMLLVRKLFVRKEDIERIDSDASNQTYIATFRVCNPAIVGKSIKDVVAWSGVKFVISRLWRENKVCIPVSEMKLQENDRLLVTTTDKDAIRLGILFGKQEQEDWNRKDIDWDALDNQLVSKDVVITKLGLNGKKLGSLRLRNTYAINISRVTRSGVHLLATPNLVLQLGDRLTIVGEMSAVQEVEKLLGNSADTLRDPNLAAIFIGVVLGLVLGSIPFAVPGISTPIKLGLAGGPIVIGILIGSFGPRFRLVTYTTRSANLMLRGIGLSLYLACLGLDAGKHFFETVMRPEGLIWVSIGFSITFIPVVFMALLALRMTRLDF